MVEELKPCSVQVMLTKHYYIYVPTVTNQEVLLIEKGHSGISAPSEPFSLATTHYSDTLKFHMWAVP